MSQPERDLRLDTSEAVAKLNRIEEFSTEPMHPDVAEFARFLAGRLNPHIVPKGFIMAAELSIYDLQKGINGFTRQPIEGNLVGRIPETYGLLRASVTGLARMVFPEEFANAVNAESDKIQSAIQKEADNQPVRPVETVTDPDVIQSPINDISQANQQIIEDAINRTMALDWGYFTVNNLVETRKFLTAIAPIILRNSGLEFPLNILDESDPEEEAILETLPEDHKTHFAEKFWLVMLADIIEPEDATFMRDWLWIKNAEIAAKNAKLPLKQTLTHFNVTTPAIGKATFRAYNYMAERGIEVSDS